MRQLQACLGELLQEGFAPYSVEQVHGTIIGLEGIWDAGELVNANFLRLRGERQVMDLRQALGAVAACSFPLRIRIGGFQASEPCPFASRQQHPYDRSASLSGEVATIMGWPECDGSYPPALDELRRSLERANVLHKYHAFESDVDNDFYFVLGRVDRTRATQDAIVEAEMAMREQLANREPVIVDLDTRHLAVVAYDDATLPLESSRAFGLREAEDRLQEIAALY